MGPRRIGILGGTFDPIHLGHLIIASELRFALRLDQVRFVPAGDPPHKPDQILSPIRHRVRMIELAIESRCEFALDSVDLERGGPSFTKDTLAALKEREPMTDFVFLMGADSLLELHTWRDPHQIVELAELGVATRPNVEIDLETVLARLPTARGRVTVVEVPLIGISSRDLRGRVAAGSPIAFQVPARIEQYIEEHRLYRHGEP